MLPYITEDFEGIGGEIKLKPSDFLVQEIPLYLPCGEGNHIYITLSRSEMTTMEVQKRLSYIFKVKFSDIGCSGLKDKQALVTQTFSIPSKLEIEKAKELLEEKTNFKIISLGRHKNKLKPGHLLGNRFTVIISNTKKDCLNQAKEILRIINNRGLPNYYGEQRFGVNGNNASVGKKILLGEISFKKPVKRFLLSSYQSELFNLWLTERIRNNIFDKVLLGDIAKKYDTGGIFEVKDLESENERLKKRGIAYTGPIYGSKMLWAKGEPGDLERKILYEEGLSEKSLEKSRLTGSRRVARVFPMETKIDLVKSGLSIEFFLPKGSYATVLLREIMKNN